MAYVLHKHFFVYVLEPPKQNLNISTIYVLMVGN
jgi:hypothetical protein